MSPVKKFRTSFAQIEDLCLPLAETLLRFFLDRPPRWLVEPARNPVQSKSCIGPFAFVAATSVCGLLLIATQPAHSAAQAAVPPASGQPAATPPASPTTTDHRITIDVTVTDKTGKPIGGLDEGDFTLLDNNQPQKLLAFQAFDAKPNTANPVRVLILVDGINTGVTVVAREREQLGEFLKQNGGELAYPTSFGFITDSGVKVQKAPSQDGNAIFTTLNGADSELRVIGRSAGFYGAADRLERSLGQLSQLASLVAPEPGRKLVLFISPGWPLLYNAGTQEDMKQREWTFNALVRITNDLLDARVALYTLDPFNLGRTNPFMYQSYLKPITKPSQAEYPNLSLQVLSEHTGGQVLIEGNDIKDEINTAVRDLTAYYELTFESAPPGEGTQYHALSVKLDKPGLKIRTTAGYYVSHP
jgi:VWFA-related protein